MVSARGSSPCEDKAWLALAGAGLEPGHLTRRLEELVRCADLVVVEAYTLPGADWIAEALRPLAGERVVAADRSLLEEGAGSLVELAMTGRVLIVAPGDPLIATTHRSILVAARERGARVILLPGVSGVCTAKAYTGLDYYKFGRTLTLPGPWRMVRPYSVLEGLAWNMCHGMHTLLLLDIDPRSGRQLDPCTGLEQLLAIEEEAGLSVLDRAEMLLVERAGMTGSRVSLFRGAGEACSFRGVEEPASVIVPSRLAPYEAEALESLHGVRARGNAALMREACILAERIREA